MHNKPERKKKKLAMGSWRYLWIVKLSKTDRTGMAYGCSLLSDMWRGCPVGAKGANNQLAWYHRAYLVCFLFHATAKIEILIVSHSAFEETELIRQLGKQSRKAR